MTPKIFCLKKSEKISKNAEFHADFESVEKFVKNAPKKVTSKTSLMNISNPIEKSAYFLHVFANNFFWVHFFKNFVIPILNFLIKFFFWLLLALFVHFDCKCAGNGSKKTENLFFYECVLEFY